METDYRNPFKGDKSEVVAGIIQYFRRYTKQNRKVKNEKRKSAGERELIIQNVNKYIFAFYLRWLAFFCLFSVCYLVLLEIAVLQK